jgi:hypothetical protein
VAVLPRPKTDVAIFARPACHRLGLVKVGSTGLAASYWCLRRRGIALFRPRRARTGKTDGDLTGGPATDGRWVIGVPTPASSASPAGGSSPRSGSRGEVRYRFSTSPAHWSIQLCAVDDDARPPPSTTARGSSRPRPKRLRTPWPWAHRHRWQDSGRGRFTADEEDDGGAREGRGTPQGRHGYWWRTLGPHA